MVFALGTFQIDKSAPFPGLVTNDRVYALDDVFGIGTDKRRPLRPTALIDVFNDWSANFAALNAAINTQAFAALKAHSIQEAEALQPLMPRQILCSGANYRKHVIDLIVDQGSGNLQHLSKEERLKHGTELMDHRAKHGKPFVFTALPTALAGAADTLTLPYDVRQPDWELELGVIIGKPARRVALNQALDHVAGYTIVNDITSRDLADRPDIKGMGLDWMACKSSPGFKILGPFITPAAFVPDPQKLRICLKLNGKVMQNESTADMIFSVARLIAYISQHVQLLPGDLLLTGSPSGNGTHYNRFLQDGDFIEGTIAGLIGTQRVHCTLEKP